MLGRLRSKVAAHRHRRHSRHVRKATKRMQRKISKIESVANDQVYITPIANIPYAHGGYFGAAPFLLADPVWVDILRQLMPDVYCEVAKRIFAPTPRLIHWAENNPVVAAYGLTYEKKTSGRVETLEWDVFLDPGLVECVEHGLAELDSLVPDASEEQEAILEGRVKLLSMHLLEKMLIAHGSGPQLLIEQLGFAKHYNFSRVKRTRRTLGGGIYAEQWLSIFADALKLGTDAFMLGAGLSPTKISEHDKPKFPDLSESQNISYPDIEMSSSSSSGCDSLSEFFDFDKSTNLVNKAFCSHSLLQSVRVITERLNQPPSVILDLKSRFVPKRVWGLVVDALRDCGVRVEGVATFYIDDIRGINEYTCTYVPEIVFFHSAGDLQYACHDGTIKKNDTVYFNAGSLLWKKEQKRKIAASSGKTFSHLDMDTAELRYTLHPCAFFNKCREDENIDSRPKFPHYHHHFRSIGHSCPTIEDYKEAYGLKIGVYAQEFAIDEIAADLLCRFVNEYSNVFDLGFSWGGVNGVTVKGIQPGRFTNTDGLWNQRYVSKQWNYNLGPNTYTT